VANIGERAVSISVNTSYGQDVTPWLSATLDRTVVDTLSPATLTLSVMKNGLSPGTYSADVYVGNSVTGGTVHVTLRVEAAPTATLTVSVHGLGSVTSSGVEPAIACYADTCSESYPLGTPVTLTANDENPDFLWESWYGTGSGFTCTTSRTCVVTMDQDRTVTAWFSAPGIVSIDPDTAGFSMTSGGSPIPSSRAITVANIGERAVGISLNTSYGQDVTPWLSATLDRTVVDTLNPATLTLSVMKNGLAPGTYTASVYVGSSFTGGTVHVTLRVLAPSPVISNVTGQLVQLNDSIICGYQNPHGSLFRFSFTYADPDGDVDQATAVLTVDYAFSSGTTGQFKQPPEPGLSVGGDGYDGTITSYICNVFGASTSVTETFTLQDAAGHSSNSLSIVVPRPEGAHIPPLGNAETQSSYSKKSKAEGARVTGG